MNEIKVLLTKEEVQDLQAVKEHKGFLFKTIEVEEDGQKHCIGSIEVTGKTIVGPGYKAIVGKFYNIEIKLGAHKGTPYINQSALICYTVVKGNIDKVLYGEHVMVNTIDGERIKIIIRPETYKSRRYPV